LLLSFALNIMKSPLAFIGSPQFAVPILEALTEEFELKVVISQPDKAVGRHRIMQPTAVAARAVELGLPVLKPAKLTHELQATLQAFKVELAVVAAYGKIIPAWMLRWPDKGMINVHGSLLPEYRGASPISQAIADGQIETGITFMLMNEGMDEGDMLAVIRTAISPQDTAATLTNTLSRLAAEQINQVVHDYLSGHLTPHPQPYNATYTKLLSREDGQIDLTNPPSNMDHLIRAYYPWPGVWSIWQGKRVKFLPESMIQIEGKKPIKLADYVRQDSDFPIKKIV
jgi:methionyl-tRNA formyltransferase